MPLETIKCPDCGSPDVKEIKAGTFFCGHCESLFKHVDPSRLTVQAEFCQCGGAIAFQCRSCRTGICQTCDLRQPFPREAGLLDWHVPIRTPCYSYALPGESQARRPLLYYFTERFLPYGGNVDTDYSDPGSLLSHALGEVLTRRFGGGGELHLCRACLGSVVGDDAMVEVAENLSVGKVSGRLCAAPECCGESEYECWRCHLRVCDRHLDHVLARWPGRNGVRWSGLHSVRGTGCALELTEHGVCVGGRVFLGVTSTQDLWSVYAPWGARA